ncbi:hypothetical protein AVM11_17875 [Sphingomonas melonis TY]|uniref:Uncharacterized protein n=1 Tax=Sphingomonas melonis TY TaxID=621456 RepID=A0A175Y2K8_9SPHN|nr:hypothetical protein AVM11_17875 [Sphingomonas melonis TY]
MGRNGEMSRESAGSKIRIFNYNAPKFRAIVTCKAPIWLRLCGLCDSAAVSLQAVLARRKPLHLLQQGASTPRWNREIDHPAMISTLD